MDLPGRVAAILFVKAEEPQTRARLAKFLSVDGESLNAALPTLRERLAAVGLTLIDNGDSLALATAPEAAAMLEAIALEERSGDLSKAALETLAVVLYQGPLSRAKIDYWRGVNSGFTLRHLSIRGLVERVPDPNDARSYLYRPTVELLAKLGVGQTEELPDYSAVRSEIAKILNHHESELNPAN